MRLAPMAATCLALACGEQPGACEEFRTSDGAKSGFCVEVDNPAQCPTLESGTEPEALRWEFHDGEGCNAVGYLFDCGEGVWDDLESEECRSTEST